VDSAVIEDFPQQNCFSVGDRPPASRTHRHSWHAAVALTRWPW